MGHVWVNHIGYGCNSSKQVIVGGAVSGRFEVQDMGQNQTTSIAPREEFKGIYEGDLKVVESPLGIFSVGDFSDVRTPGVYRVSLLRSGEHSYHFTITDGAYGWVPKLFLNFIHNWRSGCFENEWRGQTHLDDARRSDNGKMVNMVGGWYDAGDSRKWLVHTFMPAMALMEANDRLPWYYAEWERCEEGWTPWLHEAKWGIDFLAKFQEPETGMFYEDVGGGGNQRKKPGMHWWYENLSGCYGDNLDNRFTDNICGSGDERVLRIRYNPVGQLVATTILARAHRVFSRLDGSSAKAYLMVAEKGWKFSESPDPKYFESQGVDYSAWTSVRSWRVSAALELWKNGALDDVAVLRCVDDLLVNYDSNLAFWRNAMDTAEPYRGVIQSAQPLLALSKFIKTFPDVPTKEMVRRILLECLEKYVTPMSRLTPFGVIPYGVFTSKASEGDLYREWREDFYYRFFMPSNHEQKFNIGLSGHYMSWAHALALMGEVLESGECTEMAWKQIYWLFGQNPFDVTVVSGVGYGNPMPHSRLMGTFPGGFCNGFMGTEDDAPFIDLNHDAQWNTTEYWMAPLSSAFLALAILNPQIGSDTNCLGRK